MFIEFVFLHYLVMSDHYLQGERKTISVNYLLILKYWWALPKSNEPSAGEPGWMCAAQPGEGAWTEKAEQMT